MLVGSSSVLAQLTVPEQAEYHNKQTVGFGDSILGVTPVLDAPFSGEVLTTWQPTPNISRAEPPAELFEVPADYDVMAWIGNTLWLNPDVPEVWPAGASPAERCLKPWPW